MKLTEQTFLVRIATENDAFGDDPGAELARILRELADKVENQHVRVRWGVHP